LGIAIFYPQFRGLFCPDTGRAASAALFLDTVLSPGPLCPGMSADLWKGNGLLFKKLKRLRRKGK